MSETGHDQNSLVRESWTSLRTRGIKNKEEQNILQYRTVRLWMDRGNFAENTKENYESLLRNFMIYIQENGGEKFSHMNPDELIAYQKKSKRSEEEEAEYEIIDELIQPYIISLQDGSRDGTLKSKLSAIRSFFKWNRATLPEWNISRKAGISKVVGNLFASEIREICINSTSAYRTSFLCMYSGLMDQALYEYWNIECGYKSIKEDFEKRSDIILIRSPGRKHEKNIRPFYTLIGGDAVNELYNYLENDRPKMIDKHFGGDPEKATAIFYTQIGTPLTGRRLAIYRHRRLVKLKLIVPLKNGNPGNRYGKNCHEMRDTARSKVTGFYLKEEIPTEMFEFMMGHQVDKNDYDKYCNNEVAVKMLYRKAIPYFNIMTSNKALGLYDETEVEKEREKARSHEQPISDPDLAEIRADLKRNNYAIEQILNALDIKV